MAALIDTSILIRIRAKAPEYRAASGGQGARRVFLVGCHGERVASRCPPSLGLEHPRPAFVESILARFPMLAVDLATARSHSRLWAELMAAGQLIGAHDMWLAATCLSRGLTMITANVRDFERVPGLLIEVWSDEDRK